MASLDIQDNGDVGKCDAEQINDKSMDIDSSMEHPDINDLECNEDVDDNDSIDNLVIDTSVGSSPTKASKNLSNGESSKQSSPSKISYDEGVELMEMTPNQLSWEEMSGSKCRPTSKSDYERLVIPFQLGWKREVVLRAVATTTGKRIGDVYYFSSDRKVKFRSNTDTISYFKALKDPQNILSPENFSFIRQPIYTTPDETVRHAVSRVSDQYKYVAITPPATTPMNSSVEGDSLDNSLKEEGRGKRKRVAPKRFEDEEDDTPIIVKKKLKTTPKIPSMAPLPVAAQLLTSTQEPAHPDNADNGVVVVQKSTKGGAKLIRTPIGAPSAAALSNAKELAAEHNRRIKVEPPNISRKPSSTKLLKLNSSKKLGQDNHISTPQQISHEQSFIQPEPASNEQASLESPSEIAEFQNADVPPADEFSKPAKIVSRTGSTSSLSDLKVGESFSIDPRLNPDSCDPSDDDAAQKLQINEMDENSSCASGEKSSPSKAEEAVSSPTPAPCSIHCPNKRGMMPNLLCCRCLCFYHLDCVPEGIFLANPHRFLCPTCKQDGDEMAAGLQNGIDLNATDHSQSAKNGVSSAAASSSNYSIKHGNPGKPAKLKLSIKKKKSLPAQQNAAHPTAAVPMPLTNGFVPDSLPALSIAERSNNWLDRMQSLAGTRLASMLAPPLGGVIRPIEPIRPPQLTPAKLASLLRGSSFQASNGGPNKFEQWLRNQVRTLDCVTDNTKIAQLILSYLNVVDLTNLRLVNRKFNLLCSFPSLWRNLKFRGVYIDDWRYLGEKILERYQVESVSFEGVLCHRTPPADFWRYFSDMIPYMHHIRLVRFNAVPTFVIQEIFNGVASGHLSSLKELHVRNIFLADDRGQSPPFTFINNIGHLSGIEKLTISSMRGISVDDDEEIAPQVTTLLTQSFPSMASLRHLSLPSLLISDPAHFSFISSLTHLTSLELGSCRCWSSAHNQLFPLLGRLVSLRKLMLSGLLLDSDSIISFTQTLLNLSHLESLTLDKLAVSQGSGESAAHFIASLHKTIIPSLKSLTLFTDGPISNAAISSSLPALNGLEQITWRVGCFVNDVGECFAIMGQLKTGASHNVGEPVKASLRPFLDIERELKSKLNLSTLRVLPS